jgi:hypothetical protein
MYPQLEREALTRTATGVKIREGKHPLTQKFSPTMLNVETDTAKWDELLPLRDLDTVFEGRDGPATNTATGSVRPRSTQMAVTFKKREVKPELLRNLRAVGSEEKASGEQKLGLLIGDMVRRYYYERWEFLIAGALQDNLSFTINGTTHAPDFGLDATHDLTVAASWALPGTDIDADVESIKRLVAEDSGWNVTEVECGRNIFSYMRKNTILKEWFTAREGAPADWHALHAGGSTGQESIRLFGLTWTQYFNGYVSSGTWTPYIPDDKCIFHPEVSSEWFQMQQGTVMSPKSAYGTNPLDFDETWGMANWVRFKDEPPSAWKYLRWAGIAIPVYPWAYACLDVIP